MIAALPMYLRAETRAAHDALWALIRDSLRDHGQTAPDALDHTTAHQATWGRADLILGQICNLPYRTGIAANVHRIGTCDYGLRDALPGQYYSHFVVRADDPRDTPAAFATARLAINEADSHSGWGAPWLYARDSGFTFQTTIETGAHSASAQAIATGQADIAAIDAISWQLIQRYDSTTRHLRIIGRTATSPGQTLITAVRNDPTLLRAAIVQAIAALSQGHAETLMLRAIVSLPDTAYTSLAFPDAPPSHEIPAKTA